MQGNATALASRARTPTRKTQITLAKNRVVGSKVDANLYPQELFCGYAPFQGETMRLMPSRIVLLGAVLLILVGCSNKEAVKVPPPPPNAQADSQALERKMEEIKKARPDLPPSAVGTMAAKMVEEEKAQRGGRP
jgi:hypothetical protein